MISLLTGALLAIPPYGYLRHCGLTQDTACNIGRPLTGEDLAWVHAGIVGQFKPVPDADDRWELFPDAGDCEDYAISMRATLLAFGLAPDAAVIVIGNADLPERAGTHAVLEVSTGSGVWVLDSLVTPGEIYAPGTAPYTWTEQARQVPGRIAWTARGTE